MAKPTNPTQPDVSDIIISHWHHDHVGGLPSVLSLLRKRWNERGTGLPYQPPRLHKFSLASEPIAQSSSYLLPSITTSLSRDLFTPAPNGSVFNDIQDGQQLSVPSMPPLHLLHTPGHTPDSIVIYLPSDKALYTSDSVLGQGTAVFDNLSDYMSSLKRMLDYIKAQEQGQLVPLYPGHGPVLHDGADVLNTYIQHRLERELQIISVLQGTPPTTGDSAPGDWTTWMIVKIIYATYPESLWLPAMRGIDLHLRKLEVDGVVTKLGGDGKETSWRLTNGA